MPEIYPARAKARTVSFREGQGGFSDYFDCGRGASGIP
jgi:hypothetical protein